MKKEAWNEKIRASTGRNREGKKQRTRKTFITRNRGTRRKDKKRRENTKKEIGMI